jgi:diadenosine tetraphosphate (Ap4A) HIT family hydrolase
VTEHAEGPDLRRIWAGWRSTYVAEAAEGGLGADDHPEGSIFTRLLASGRPDAETLVVWRGERCFAILNRFPYTTGHLLVMPYREVADLEDLEPDEAVELWAAVTDAVRALKTAYQPHGLNIGFNLGEAAGAGVRGHLHAHVLPRWTADSNFMTAAADTRVMPESLPDTWAKLRSAWPSPSSA